MTEPSLNFAAKPQPPTDEQLYSIWETGHLPTPEELANDCGENDLLFLFTSAYYRSLDEDPEAMAEHEIKCLRAVFNFGARWGAALAQPPADDEVAKLVQWLRSQDGGIGKRAIHSRIADLLERQPQPVPVSERLQQMEDLAADAVSGLRYIEESHGRLYGVGWDRVYEKADQLKPAHALPLPSEEELTQFLFESFRSPIEFICDAEAEAHLVIRNHVKFARAVLERWGTAEPQPQPIPVSERLPEAGDCTAQGWCWVLYQGFATWTLEPPLGQDGKHTGYTHWLPAHALPLPSEEEAP